MLFEDLENKLSDLLGYFFYFSVIFRIEFILIFSLFKWEYYVCYLRIHYMISPNQVINTSTFYTAPAQYNPNTTVHPFDPSQSM